MKGITYPHFEIPEEKKVYLYFESGFPTTMTVPLLMKKYYPSDWTGHIASKKYYEQMTKEINNA